MNLSSSISNIYKSEEDINRMVKKRVSSLTLDADVVQAIEDIRSAERFKPPFSQVVNSLLKEHKEIKERLKKNGR